MACGGARLGARESGARVAGARAQRPRRARPRCGGGGDHGGGGGGDRARGRRDALLAAGAAAGAWQHAPLAALADAPLGTAAAEAAAEKLWDFPVPLTVETVRGCAPERWASEFRGAMAKTARLKVSQNASLAAAYARLGGAGAGAKGKKNKKPLPDLLALGDGYVGAAVAQELVRPLPPLRAGGVVGRSDGDAAAAILGSSKWAAVTRRQRGTGLAGAGSAELYAWPYRFGCALIAYRKDKLRRMGLPGGRPPSTWADLLSPSLRGRVAFPGAPRELCAYALAAAADAEGRSPGDPERVSEAELSAALGALRGAALCFDSGRYLSALRAGDAWVAVGWSSDVVPTASRSPTTIGHVAPETGSPLWADVFVAPAATESHGGGLSHSPLAGQYLEFVSQPARAADLRGATGGASPLLLDCGAGLPQMFGLRPPEWLPSEAALGRSAFLTPLPRAAEDTYARAIRSMR